MILMQMGAILRPQVRAKMLKKVNAPTMTLNKRMTRMIQRRAFGATKPLTVTMRKHCVRNALPYPKGYAHLKSDFEKLSNAPATMRVPAILKPTPVCP